MDGIQASATSTLDAYFPEGFDHRWFMEGTDSCASSSGSLAERPDDERCLELPAVHRSASTSIQSLPLVRGRLEAGSPPNLTDTLSVNQTLDLAEVFPHRDSGAAPLPAPYTTHRNFSPPSKVSSVLHQGSLSNWEFSDADMLLERKAIQGMGQRSFLVKYPILVVGELYALELKGTWIGAGDPPQNADRVNWKLVFSGLDGRISDPDALVLLHPKASFTSDRQLVLKGCLSVQRFQTAGMWQIEVGGCRVLSEICTASNLSEVRAYFQDIEFARKHAHCAALQTSWFSNLALLGMQGKETESWRKFIAEVNIQVSNGCCVGTGHRCVPSQLEAHNSTECLSQKSPPAKRRRLMSTSTESRMSIPFLTQRASLEGAGADAEEASQSRPA